MKKLKYLDLLFKFKEQRLHFHYTNKTKRIGMNENNVNAVNVKKKKQELCKLH